MFPRTRRSVPGADRTDGKTVDMFLGAIARTGKSVDQFLNPIARTGMSYVTAILYPRAIM
jgi:hypothetical protein